MLERKTPQVRSVLVAAPLEARAIGHNYVGVPHLVVALIAVKMSIAAEVFASMGITPEAAREAAQGVIGFRPAGTAPIAGLGSTHFTLHVRAVFERSDREAQRLGSQHTDTEHILLAALEESSDLNDALTPMLNRLGTTASSLRNRVYELL